MKTDQSWVKTPQSRDISSQSESPVLSPSPKGRVLIIDDDGDMRSLLRDFFSNQGFSVEAFGSASEALKLLEHSPVDVVISDIHMPEMDGLELTAQIQSLHPEIPVVLITAFGSIETAIEAMRRGAFHYIVKPFKLAEISVNVDRALEHRRLKQDNQLLRQEIRTGQQFAGILGKSSAMRSIFDLIQRVAPTTANVLIQGESGTGKERIARAIHDKGPRRHKPFVAINCTAIPESLLESELFGHAKGSFTGAIQRKRGLFEEAEGGTLFLDEIGDMEPALQSKLLRVIQERKIRAVGDTTDRDIDVRLIAATHKDLKEAIRNGRFREDLFYRLSVIPLRVPPLRERSEDIPLLAEHFLRKVTAQNDSSVKGFSPKALQKLMRLRWEGNVRELENVVERAVVLCRGTVIDETDIPSPETETPEQFHTKSTQDWPTLAALEERYIQQVLEKTGGRKERAAQILGINRRTLLRKEHEYGWTQEAGK